MKKLLLSIFAVAAIGAVNAQVTVYSASDLADFQNMSIADVDQDGKAWGVFDLTGAGSTFDAQADMLGSRSWDTVALTPDNWVVTPSIDLTGMTSCNLEFGVVGFHPTDFAENYSVYAVTAANVNAAFAAFASATPIFTETIATGNTYEVKSVSLASMDNTHNVYIGIRHHACTNQNLLLLDDITVTGTGTPSAIVENVLDVTTYAFENELFVNSTENLNNAQVNVLNTMGQTVASFNANGTANRFDLSNLSAGVYLVNISSEGNAKTSKITVK